MLKQFILLSTLLSALYSQEWKYYTASNSGLPNDQVYALVIAPDGTVWAGTGGGVAAFKNGVWNHYDTLNSILPDNYITALAVDSSGAVWIGTGYKGAARLQNGNWTLYSTENSLIPHNTIFDITVGPDNTPWFATHEGVANLKNGVWKNIAEKMIEPHSRSVAFDRQGTLWMGTYAPTDFRGYIEYMKGDSFSHTALSKLDLISTHASTMVPLNDSVMMVGTGNGLAKVTNGVWTIYHKQDSPLPANGIASMAFYNDTLIVGTASGVAEIAGSNWNITLPSANGLPNDIVYAAAVDRHGNRWYATGNSGIAVHRKGGIISSVPRRTPVPNAFLLMQNYPNPFNPSTTIGFRLQASGFTTLKIYDAVGREAAVLVNEDLEAGVYHQKTFDASTLSSGIYFARLVSGGKSRLIKLMLLK